MPSTVTNKGQVTIPKAVRAKLGIVPGNVVTFEIDADGRVVLVKMAASIKRAGNGSGESAPSSR